MKRIASFMLVLFMLFGGAFSLISLPQAQAEDVKYLVPGGNLVRTLNETIPYSNKTIESYVNTYDSPGYADADYTCGINAGVNLIAWYNRSYSALIPGHTAGSTVFGKWKWAAQSTAIDNLFPTVNTLMNGSSNGVTLVGYINGLNSYVTGKNRSFSSYSLMNSNGTLNPSYKTQLSSGKMLSIFLNGFNVTFGPTSYSGYDQLILEEYAGTHIMIVYGWTDVTYYNSQNAVIRKDIYLNVGTALSPSNAMLLISSYCHVDDLYVTHVS